MIAEAEPLAYDRQKLIERLQTSLESHNAEMHAVGYAWGRQWAIEEAEWIELKRLYDFCLASDWQYHLLWKEEQEQDLIGTRLLDIMSHASFSTRLNPTTFWIDRASEDGTRRVRRNLPPNSEEIARAISSKEAGIRGFVDGALEVWRDVRAVFDEGPCWSD